MSGAHIAAHVAAEQQRRQQEEEESMTRYSDQELSGDWEFKIIRSATGTFKNPMNLNQALEQERMGGWVLVEKFDNSRVRLKRPASARQQDMNRPRGYDPYRTSYGINEGLLAVSVIVGILAVVGVVLLILWQTGNLS